MTATMTGLWRTVGLRYWILVCVALVYALGLEILVSPKSPWMNGDSLSYIQHYPYRLSGYPLFLKFVGLPHALGAQAAVFVLSLFYLALAITRLSKSVVAALFVFFFVAANPYVVEIVFTVGSEALFLPLIALLSAVSIDFIRRPSAGGGLLAGLIVGLACTIRPSGWALAGAVAIMVVLAGAATRRMIFLRILAAVTPIVLLIGAEQGYNRAIHGAASTSIAGTHLYAKAASMDAPADPIAGRGDEARLARWLSVDYAAARAVVAAAPNSASRERLRLAYESCAADACGDAVRAQTGLKSPEVNRVCGQVALARIERHPLALAVLDWKDYWALWRVFHDPGLSPAFNDYVAAHRPLPFETLLGDRLVTVKPSRIGGVGNLALSAAAVALLAACAAGLWMAFKGRKPDADLAVAVAASLIVQLPLLMTALTAPAVSRFLIGVWPAFAVAILYMAIIARPYLWTSVEVSVGVLKPRLQSVRFWRASVR